MLNNYVLLWLNTIQGMSINRLNGLISFFETPRNIWDSSYNDWKHAPFMNEKVLSEMEKTHHEDYVYQKKSELDKQNVSFVSILDKEYPRLLKEIDYAPIILYYKGSLPSSKDDCISIIGSRRCTPYGAKISKDFSFELAKNGLVVVSGFARGIDTQAHIGAIEAGGKTLAVMGSGLDICYPPENYNLMNEMLEKDACFISEYYLGVKPLAKNFPARNRIISGLSMAVLVTEAGLKSGTLITVNNALEQGRDVFAVPGNISVASSAGTNELIKHGAGLVTNVSELLEALNISPLAAEETVYAKNIYHLLDKDEKIIYDCLGYSPVLENLILMDTGFSEHELLYLLTTMEIKGYLTKVPGKGYFRSL